MATDPLDPFERLFRAAQMHAPEERAGFLDAACADDPTLRRELESLLDADAETGLTEDFDDALKASLDGAEDIAEIAEQVLAYYRTERLTPPAIAVRN